MEDIQFTPLFSSFFFKLNRLFKMYMWCFSIHMVRKSFKPSLLAAHPSLSASSLPVCSGQIFYFEGAPSQAGSCSSGSAP